MCHVFEQGGEVLEELSAAKTTENTSMSTDLLHQSQTLLFLHNHWFVDLIPNFVVVVVDCVIATLSLATVVYLVNNFIHIIDTFIVAVGQ